MAIIGKEQLGKWAVARAFGIGGRGMAPANVHSATCKICGASLPKRTGEQVTLAGLRYHVAGTAYVCSDCATYIRSCQEMFPD